MKKNIINIISFTCFISLTIYLLILVGNILKPEWVYNDYEGQTFTTKGFYEIPKKTIDIVFLGDSSIYKGFSPMEMYNKYGITSYNYGVSSARSYELYYQLKEILKYQKPKVVVLDNLTWFYEEMEVEPEQRKSFDDLKLNFNKMNMISDDVFNTTFFDKISYLFPVFRYHTRWSDFDSTYLDKLQKSYKPVGRGYVFSSNMIPNKNGSKYMKPANRKVSIQPYVMKYIVKTIELCKEENIELILLGMTDQRAWSYEQSIESDKIAEKYNLKFVDLNRLDWGLNWNTDTEDGGMHLNTYGAMKLSDYISDYFNDNYNFEDRRGDKNYSDWDEDYKIYLKLKNNSLKTLNSIKRK